MSDLAGALETKSFGALHVKNAEQGEVTAVVATLSVVDRDGDALLPGAFPEQSGVKISAYGHNVVLDGAAPVGKGTISVVGNKAVFHGNYFMSTEAGREAFHTVKELGSDGDWSFGFPPSVQTTELTAEWRAKGARRLITGIRPLEVSPVFRGAGIGTGTVAAKGTRSDAHLRHGVGAFVSKNLADRGWRLQNGGEGLPLYAAEMKARGDLPLALELPANDPLRLCAEYIVKHASALAGCTTVPAVQFVAGKGAVPGGWRGEVFPNDAGGLVPLVVINAEAIGDDLSILAEVCCHEPRHLAQATLGLRDEADADAFAATHAAALLAEFKALQAPRRTPFGGSSLEPAFNPRLLYELPRPKPRRTEFSYDRQSMVAAKYQTGMWQPTSTVGEAAWQRLDRFASYLFSAALRYNGGNPTAWQGNYDALASAYAYAAGGRSNITPAYSRELAINFGVNDLYGRLAEVIQLENQLGEDQLRIFRAAHGAEATPTSAQIRAIMPPRLPQPVRGET